MQLKAYLQLSESPELDPEFLKELEKLNYKCHVHNTDLSIRRGYKLSPNISVSLLSAPIDHENPYALCWSKGFKPEKHGPNQEALIVFCEQCQKNQKELS